MLQQLSARHTVRLLDVHRLTGDEAIAREQGRPLSDIYLLKSHTLQALEVAYHLERRGALVVNGWASSSACQDRVLMAQRMQQAQLPWPLTWEFPASQNAPGQFPLLIKSRYSCRGDLVAKVDSPEELQMLAGQLNQG